MKFLNRVGRARRLAMRLAPILPFCAVAAVAQTAHKPDSEDDVLAQRGQKSFGRSLPEPLATWNGLRPTFENQGITFASTYISDAMTSPYNGSRPGSTHFGRFEATLDFNLEKILGWSGATLHAGSFYMHGVGLSRHYLLTEAAVSDIEGAGAPRLNDIWLEQKIGDKLMLRLGKIAADSESFFFIPSASLPVGGAFGWNPMMSQDLPNGGPGYPFAWAGAMARYEASENVAFQAAVFDGDGVGPGDGDAQLRDKNGLRFRVTDPPFAIGEAQFKYVLPLWNELSGEIRLGGWRHFGRFNDLRLNSSGATLAAPSNAAGALTHRGNGGVYLTFEQQIWRARNKGNDGVKGESSGDVTIWGRMGFAPADRNFISFYIDGGVNFNNLFPNRPGDRFGLAGYFSRVGSQARRFDEDMRLLQGPEHPFHDYEAQIEATYAFEIEHGFIIQPNVQFVFHPGNSGGRRLDNGYRKPSIASVVGLRTIVKY